MSERDMVSATLGSVICSGIDQPKRSRGVRVCEGSEVSREGEELTRRDAFCRP